MPRNRRKHEKQARKQIDRANGMRRKRDDDESHDGDDNGDTIQLKEKSRKEKYRM